VKYLDETKAKAFGGNVRKPEGCKVGCRVLVEPRGVALGPAGSGMHMTIHFLNQGDGLHFSEFHENATIKRQKKILCCYFNYKHRHINKDKLINN
jgi:hypothetical protein